MMDDESRRQSSPGKGVSGPDADRQQSDDWLNLTYDAIIVRDLDATIRYWNRGAERQYGWTREEVLGRRSHTLLETEFPISLEAAYTALIERGRWEGKLVHSTREGDRIVVDSRWALQRDEWGRPTTVFEINHDITAQEQAEAQRAAAQEEVARQAERLRVLHEIDRAILGAGSPEEATQAAVHHIRVMAACHRAGIVLFDSEAGLARVTAVDTPGEIRLPVGSTMPLDDYPDLAELREGHMAVVHDMRERPSLSVFEAGVLAEGAQGYMAIPLIAAGQLIGVCNCWRQEPGPFPPDVVEMARQAADSLAVATHNARLAEQVKASRARLQELSRHLVQAQEAERKAIARELHDEAGQSLTALTIGLALLQRECHCDSGDAGERFAELKQITDQVSDGLHRLSRNLRPASLDRLGLVPALREHVAWFERQTGIEVDFVPAALGDERLAPEAEITLYRVVQEALTNVARHARATRSVVILKRRGKRVLAIVEDNGTGFDVKSAIERGRLGLMGMRERAELLGGRCIVESKPGQGTTVFVEVPADAGVEGQPTG